MVLATGTRTSVKDSSAVSLDHMPSFSSLRDTATPGMSVGTTMSDMPREPGSSEVRASRQSQSACVPFVMYSLAPLMTHSSPSRTARVRMPATSLPASGSVTAMDVTTSPRMAGARYRSLSSCEP